ncbi:toll/interleukin-1 receptor domain-containing protein [Pandoraea communis]|uniref:toll/interleukin-1 receptor domain-containing protein n=1 Tax=Pandoraea communis TaxID=2508297 RepID=UPI0025A50E4A|nr:toll/interleukin-1 receptor domain-containing protein [Pandoraea communis]MDM8359021.1 toll/interleukin-1 receptor domain-containing protein [Pandoraea communis]
MSQKIFLSHTHKDKPLVEAVALKLATLFGQEQVFYDSWSIRPGDSIIEQMGRGLDAPEFVFFFVSEDSLASEMVKLEWQSALVSVTRGKTRLIAVRVDGSEMPALLMPKLYIDMHTIGLDAGIAQIVSTIQGNRDFVPRHRAFSNLTYSLTKAEDESVEVTVRASHLMEPNPYFAFVLMNEQDEIFGWIKGHAGIHFSFVKGMFELNEGGLANAVLMRPLTGNLTPKHPLTFQIRKRGCKDLLLVDVLHDQGQNKWSPVPVGSQDS